MTIKRRVCQCRSSKSFLKIAFADFRTPGITAKKREKFKKFSPDSPNSLFKRMQHNDEVAKLVADKVGKFVAEGGWRQVHFSRESTIDNNPDFDLPGGPSREEYWEDMTLDNRREMRRLWYLIRMLFHCIEADTPSYAKGGFETEKFISFKMLGESLQEWFEIILFVAKEFFENKFVKKIRRAEGWERSKHWENLWSGVMSLHKKQLHSQWDPTILELA